MEKEIARIKEQLRFIFEKLDHIMNDLRGTVKDNKSDIKELDGRIDTLEQYRTGNEIQMRNFVEQIKKMVTMQTWLVGTLIVSLLGFFIWYIQSL